VGEGNSSEERQMIFKQMAINFLQFYKFDQDNGSTNSEGFKTLFGVIKHNNSFKLETNFQLSASNSKYTQDKAIFYNIEYSNFEAALPINIVSKHVSYLDRLISYSKARFQAGRLFDYRWTYKRDDFQFSSLYSGKELVAMPGSRYGDPSELNIISYAKNAAGTDGFSDYIFVSMSVCYDDQLTDQHYNVVYGYWDRAKKSARAM
jgi:hypothetical protein